MMTSCQGKGRLSPNNLGAIPPMRLLPHSPSLSPSLCSLPFPSCCESAPLKPPRGSGEHCKLPKWGLGQSPSHIGFGVLWEGKTSQHWQQLVYGFFYTENSTLTSITSNLSIHINLASLAYIFSDSMGHWFWNPHEYPHKPYTVRY